MKQNILVLIGFIILISSCEQKKGAEHTIEKKSENTEDSFYAKIKKTYPALDLQLDTSVLYNEEYKKLLQLDSANCNSFSLNRNYFGNINNVLFQVESNDNKNYRCHIKSGNLKLWVCKLPTEIKVKEKILVSALVYDNNGFEKLYGYPAIITSIKIK
jgi:hypothetical protein